MGKRNDPIVCAYTGATCDLQHVLGIGWIVRGAYDPCAWQDELLLISRLRGGKKRGSLRCAYTGKSVEIVRKGGFARADGAFTPAQVWAELDHLQYDMACRPGVVPDFLRDSNDRLVVGEERTRFSDPSVGFGAKTQAGVDNYVQELLQK